jgi:carotenoid cleavage dioxygenase-like enzyme
VLDLKEGHLSCDFPVVNPLLQGRESRFGFIASFRPGTALITRGVHKLDLAKIGPNNAAEAGFIPFGKGYGGGECVFVPRDSNNSRGEDDGFLVTFVDDESNRQSHLCVWDAYTMNPAPVARVLMPQRVPYGFHGTFVPERDFARVTARL